MDRELSLQSKGFGNKGKKFIENVHYYICDVCEIDNKVNDLLDDLNGLTLKSDSNNNNNIESKKGNKQFPVKNRLNRNFELRAPIPENYSYKSLSNEEINEVFEAFYKMDIMYKRIQRKIEKVVKYTLPQYVENHTESVLRPLEEENLRLKKELIRRNQSEVKTESTQTCLEDIKILTTSNLSEQLNEDEEIFKKFPNILLQQPIRTRYFGTIKK